MIGLRRYAVRVIEHDPEWAALFAIEAARLRDQLGDLAFDIQHIGSTAVPDLAAKPILDIAVAVSSRETIPAAARRLREAGYIDRGDSGSDGGYLLVQESEPDVRTAHIHIVEASDSQWHHYIIVREMLRRDASIRCSYADLKRRLAEQYGNDRESYTAGNHDFIRRLLDGRGAAEGLTRP